ncbi:hypothetical protein UPYG_G00091730 [Umbra pygmaea]|uniref:Uncharacterized protein n=1 Tax=Umbra pygmaea TaxID=75934 RepID=A0ABD0XFX6_UMBPY
MAYLEFKSEDQVTKYIREQELATSQKFVILNKDKSFGQKDAQPLEGKKLSWENKSIPLFSGVPFQIVGTKTYECHQGKDRKTRAKEKYAAEVKKKALEEHAIVKRRKLLVNTKKVDCKAMINIAHVIRFPDFKVNESTVRSKTEASRTLKKTLSEMPSSVRSEVVYCVRFPTLSEHSSHPVVGEEAYVRETVDVRVKEKIEQLTLSGVRKVTEIKRNLNFFIEEELFHGEQPPPHSRRRYYPTDSDIRNVMFKTKTTRESVVQHKHSSSGQQGGGPERTSVPLTEGCVVHAGPGTPLPNLSSSRSNLTSIETRFVLPSRKKLPRVRQYWNIAGVISFVYYDIRPGQ